MAFKNGDPKPKTSGRKKGTPNKKTQSILELCQKKNIDVFEALLDLAIAATDSDKKFKYLAEIAQYLYSKRKAVEHSGEIAKRKILDITRPDGTGVRITESEGEDK